MHCGQSNPAKDYVMKDMHNEFKVLKTTRLEKDLGIIVSDDLKASEHCQTAAKKATRALRLLRMAFCNITSRNFNLLYVTYVRPHLDYCLQAVGPHMLQDLRRLEGVQRRATKLARDIRDLPYQ